MEFKFVPCKELKEKPSDNALGFGKYITDYMFEMDYEEGIGWHNGRIVPYAPILMDPASLVFHYAQEAFEGMKAYRNGDTIQLFRPYMNASRMNKSCERICMATIPEDLFVAAVKAIVKQEEEWIPKSEGTSLYIRPFIFATETGIGVAPSKKYKFMILCSPVGSYYPEGINPVKIYVEDNYVRATPGGTGAVKCGGNYASSIIAQSNAKKHGYAQVLWLDGIHREFVEEVGTMNVMFKIKGEIYTAPLDGSILPGITRDSILTILRSWGYKVHEEKISIFHILDAAKKGELEEVWGTGTAAVISPVGELNYKGDIAIINNFKTGELTEKLYNYLTGIQWGKVEDPYNWVTKL